MPCLGFMPAIPAIKKYVFLRLKKGESTKAEIVAAALISDSPVTSWQTDPSVKQWASGKSGLKPGTVTFFARRLPIEPREAEFVYQISASGRN